MRKCYSTSALIVVTLTVAILLFGLILPTQAQNPTPTPTPDVIATLEYQSEQINKLNNELENARLDMREEIVTWLIGTTVLGAILGGVAGAIGVREYLKKRFEEHIANAIYAVDPTHMIVHLPDKDFTTEERILQKLGFKRIFLYPHPQLPDRVFRGILVYPAKGDTELTPLLEIIQEKMPDPEYFALVAYRGQYDPNLVGEFSKVTRFTISNMAATLPSQIYAVARGLKP